MTIQAIGHRGCRGLRPELTLPGFEFALDLNVDALELDVGVTADLAVVIHHDMRLNPDIARDRNGRWISPPGPKIRDLSLKQLLEFEVGRINPESDYANQFNAQIPLDGCRVPTLEDLARRLRELDRSIPIYIEAKTSPLKPDDTWEVERFADVLASEIERLDIVSCAIVESFDWRILRHIRKRSPQIEIAPVTSAQPAIDNVSAATDGAFTGGLTLADTCGSLAKLASALDARTWCSDARDLNEARIREAHAEGMEVLAWTVNDADAMLRLIDIGVDGIVTDYPDRLISLLAKET